jgi:hypothetical protein
VTQPNLSPRRNLTIGELIAVLSLSLTILGGVIDLRVQVAVLRTDVLAIRHDLDRIQRLAHVDRSTEAQTSHRWPQGSPFVSPLVQTADLVGAARPARDAAAEQTIVRSLRDDPADNPGNRRRSYCPASWRLAAILRSKKSAITLS